MSPLIASLQQQIIALCKAHGVSRLDVFGSAAREDFDPRYSDFDAVIEFDTPTKSGLQGYFGFKQKLEALLQRPVDLVELDAMPDTRLKRIIQRSKVPLYAAQG